MPRIELRRAAKSELRDAARWYEKQKEGLGSDFIHRINVCLDLIQRQPELFPVVHQNIRRGNVQRFPFSIFYYIADERIVVLSVFHTSRDPEIWKNASD